jgi:D-alanyl-D-alanine carboxypeptidase
MIRRMRHVPRVPHVRVRSTVLSLAAACVIAPAGHGGAQQAALDSLRSSTGVPGVSVAIVLADGEVRTFTSGTASADGPVRADLLFEVGSITKTYTAALVLKLAEEGALTLDDPLARWKPAFPHVDGITVRHLLQHTSGLADYTEDPDYIPALRTDFARVWEPTDSYAFMGDPLFPPGEGWRYANAGYVLLGEVVEAVTGTTFAAALRARILDPLALRHTWLDVAERPEEPRAHAHLDIDGDGAPEDLSALVPNTSFLSAAWSAGAVVATAADLARWIHAPCSGDVLDAAGQRAFTDWVDRGDGMEYGLGIIRYRTPRGRVLWGHKGNTAGFSAGAWHDPERRVTVAVLTNGHGVDVTPIAVALLAAVAP